MTAAASTLVARMPAASNYDADANVDDGSCQFPGCTDDAAANYDASANVDDGSCQYNGCTDAAAVNYDAGADIEDGSCLYGGCTDGAACNFDADADVEDGSCTYPLADNVDCDGNCFNDSDGDGICDEDESSGCMDPMACNYDPALTEDDGSCEYCSCSGGGAPGLSSFDYATDAAGYGLRMERVADHTTGILAGQTTWRLHATVPHADDMLSSVYGNEDPAAGAGHDHGLLSGRTRWHVCQQRQPAVARGLPGPRLRYLVDDRHFRHAQCGSRRGGHPGAQSPNQGWILGFEAGGDVVMDDPVGGAWFVTNVYTNGIAGDDLEVLLGQFTTAGDFSGTLNYQVFIHGDGDTDLRATVSFNSLDLAGESGAACGCTDEEADNYDATAVYDDGSCFQEGCTDAGADNYNPSATDDDGSCAFLGCTDANALNYDPNANTNDGSCIYPGCTNPEATNYSAGANFDDGTCILGMYGSECGEL